MLQVINRLRRLDMEELLTHIVKAMVDAPDEIDTGAFPDSITFWILDFNPQRRRSG